MCTGNPNHTPNHQHPRPKIQSINPSRPLLAGLAVVLLAAVMLAPDRVLAHLLSVVPQLVLLHFARGGLRQGAEDDAFRGLFVLGCSGSCRWG